MSEFWLTIATENVLDKCKCCLSEMELKTLWDQHEFEGDGEVYGEMLNECFGISFHQPDPSEQICELCIVRLREALEFKKEILATQEMLQEGAQVVKEEVLDEEPEDVPTTYDNVEFLEEEDKSDDDYIPDDASSSPEDSSPESPKNKYPKKCEKKTYKQYTRKDLQNAVWEVRNGKMACAEAGRTYGVPRKTIQTKVREYKSETSDVVKVKEEPNEKFCKFLEEIQTLLTYTNATPFKSRGFRYYCFYCSTNGPLFEDPDELRSHTTTKHDKERITNIELYMKPQWMNEIIKFDITDLHCTECLLMLPDWNNMFVHFAETHDIGFDEAYTRVIPYSLTADLQCVLCHENFANYGNLDAHMNLHFSNYVCFKCGDTFLSVSRFDKHLLTHQTGHFPCPKCDKVFSLKKYMTRHFTLVHKQQTPKCVYCKKSVEGPMHRHITKEHSEKVKAFTCEVCGKVFTWKPYFVAHMRKRHNGIKKFKCEYCPKMFLMPYELKTHSIIHTRARLFECGECRATFNTITAMKKHISVHKPSG